MGAELHGKRGSGGALRAAGFSLLVLLAVTLAVLRGVDAWQKAPMIAELHRPPAFAVPRDFDFGRYRLSWLGNGFEVHPVAQPDRVLWGVEGGFLAAGIGRGEGGAWEPRELLCREQSLESFERQGTRLRLKGHVRCDDGHTAPYELVLEDDGRRGIALTVALEAPELNRLYLGWVRDPGEAVFGVDASGISRSLSGQRLVVAGRGGEEGAPGAFYLTSRLRGFHSLSAASQVLDLRDPRRVGLEVREGRLVAYFLIGDSPAELLGHRDAVERALPRRPAPD